MRSIRLTPLLLLAACASNPPPEPLCPVTSTAAATPPLPPPPPTDPYVRVLVTPRSESTKYVHVEMELLVPASPGTFRIPSATVEAVPHVTMADPGGPIETKVAPDGESLVVTPARAPAGVTRVSYDVMANTESPWKPLSEKVLDDRFVGAGEGLILLPEAMLDRSMPVEVAIDGAPLKVPNAVTSWGLGSKRRTTTRPRALWHLSFLAGALGAAELDASEGHDEAAWLGYTAFDPRPVVAEIAETRTAMAELFKAGEPPRGTTLFFTQPRPLGSYTTTPRAGGLLLQLGPSEPWSAPLRISVAQQLIRPWIGGELWVGSQEPGHIAESYWFNEGFARFLVTRLLGRTGMIRPDDVRDVLVGETSAILASPYRGKSNAELAALTRTDPIARAHLVARGSLYAARVNALVRDKSKGTQSIDTLVLGLLEQARKERKPLPASAWVDAVAAVLGPTERDVFAKTIEQGQEVTLPGTVLGHCYHPGTGEYVDFNLGFDDTSTREGKSGEVVGLVPGGPAAKAGLKAGDVVTETAYRVGHSEVPVKLTVKRGSDTAHVTYLPAGSRHKGPIWTRAAGTPDEKCADAW